MLIDELRQDLRYAVRQMVNAPALTIVMIGMLALGMGANSALYSVMDRLISRPAPGIGSVEGQVQLSRRFEWQERGRSIELDLSYPDFLDLRAQPSVFADLAVSRRIRVGVRAGDMTAPVSGYLVSSSYFSVLRVRMELGTGFPRADDGRPDPNPIAIVSHRFWQQRLGGMHAVIGQRIDVKGIPFTIVGVTPRLFNGAQLAEDDYDLWLPLATLALLQPDAGAALISRDSTHYEAIALLQPGVSSEAASAVATSTAIRIAQQHPPRWLMEGVVNPAALQRVSMSVRSLTIVPREDVAEAFLIMSWVGGTPVWLVLLVVCANVSGLLLARAVVRRTEVAVRFSLGASRPRVVRQLLTEAVLLALLASGAGILILYWATIYFESMFPVELDVPIQWRTVGFTVGFASAVGVLFGLLPALHAARTSVFDALKGMAGTDARGSRLQRRFVVAQLTLSLPLLIAAGWYLAGSQRVGRSDRGFETGINGLGVTLDLHLRGYNSTEVDALLTRARERMAALPGVRNAAFATNVPLFSHSYGYFLNTPAGQGRPRSPTEMLRASAASIDPEYLRVMQIPIRRGRDIQPTDHAGAPFVAVVSEDFARTTWPGLDPIGQTLTTRMRRDTSRVEVSLTVVGVAGAVRVGPSGETEPVVYVARKQLPPTGSATLVLRTNGPATPLLSTVRRELERLDPQLPLRELATFDRRLFDAMDIDRKVARFSLLAGLLILFMASVGVYAVIAFNVAQRTREIGIRMALGARAAQVAGGFVRQGLRLAAFGLVLGVPIALIMRRAFTDLLYDLDATVNGLALAAVAATLLLIVALASWLPARRAARVDPVNALRAE
jgi:putative ABC transport system permease protein